MTFLAPELTGATHRPATAAPEFLNSESAASDDVHARLLASEDVPWLRASWGRVEELLRLPDNWDQNGAPRPARAVAAALAALSDFMPAQALPPVFAPTAEGGVSLHWRAGGWRIDVEVQDFGDAVVVASCAASGEAFSGDLSAYREETTLAIKKASADGLVAS